jgi:hypothetical protein
MTAKGKSSGLAEMRKKVNARGMEAVDQRRTAARAVRTWRAELLQDLGGEADVSTQRRTIIELCARTRLYIEHIDAWLIEQGGDGLVNKRKGALRSAVVQRQSLVDSLARLLGQLGLERQAKPVEDLETYQRRRAAELEREKETTDEQQSDDPRSD